jgi:hypothetical protein
MSHKFLLEASFHSLLIQIDQELSEAVIEESCPHCGGQLHHANYPRSPFGLPPPLRLHYNNRISFCCATCRKRVTPPSVRFFGRRWFPAPVFLLICILSLGINERRLAQVKRHFGITVSESTWKRWRRWWRESFESTPFWQAKKSLIVTALNESTALPRALLDCFQGKLQRRLLLLLQFLSPLTGGLLRAV